MTKIQIRFGKKTKGWFDKMGITRLNLQIALNKALEKEFPDNKFRKKYINIKVDPRYLDSGYFFGSNTLEIGVAPFKRRYDKKSRRKEFVRDLLHEFRHWIQDKIFKVRETELDYSLEDINYKTKKYYNNKWEVDARKYASKNFQRAFRILFNK